MGKVNRFNKIIRFVLSIFANHNGTLKFAGSVLREKSDAMPHSASPRGLVTIKPAWRYELKINCVTVGGLAENIISSFKTPLFKPARHQADCKMHLCFDVLSFKARRQRLLGNRDFAEYVIPPRYHRDHLRAPHASLNALFSMPAARVSNLAGRRRIYHCWELVGYAMCQ